MKDTGQFLDAIEELEELRGMYKAAATEGPLTLAEYQRQLRDGITTEDDSIFLFLSSEEAATLVKDGRPRVSFVVPRELNSRSEPLRDIQQHLLKIAEMQSIQAHDLESRRLDNKQSHVLPVTKPAKKIVEELQDETKVLNCLDMSIPTLSTVPSFIRDAEGWDLLPFSRTGFTVSKPTEPAPNDLSASSTFQLLASKGAWSMPHIDRAGVVTSVRCEAGEKMWLSWSSRSTADLKGFGLSSRPIGRGVSILLRPGDTLVQPAGTPHAPYTGSLCFMTGNMFTPSQNVDRQVECMVAEAWTGSSITNEEPAKETLIKLDWWAEMMQGESKAWPWPGRERQQTFHAQLSVSCANTKKHCLANLVASNTRN